jgi:hypothetical protein
MTEATATSNKTSAGIGKAIKLTCARCISITSCCRQGVVYGASCWSRVMQAAALHATLKNAHATLCSMPASSQYTLIKTAVLQEVRQHAKLSTYVTRIDRVYAQHQHICWPRSCNRQVLQTPTHHKEYAGRGLHCSCCIGTRKQVSTKQNSFRMITQCASHTTAVRASPLLIALQHRLRPQAGPMHHHHPRCCSLTAPAREQIQRNSAGYSQGWPTPQPCERCDC